MGRAKRNKPRKKKRAQPVPEQRPASPTEGPYTTHVDYMSLPGGGRMIDCRFEGNGRDIVIGNVSGELPNAALNLGGDVGDMHFSGWTNRPHMIAGGSIGRLRGEREHEPGAEHRSAAFGYSSAEQERPCKCGHVAYRFTRQCPKCHRRIH